MEHFPQMWRSINIQRSQALLKRVSCLFLGTWQVWISMILEGKVVPDNSTHGKRVTTPLPPGHWLLKARVGTSPQGFLGREWSAGHECLTLVGTSGNSLYSPPLTCGDAEALEKWGFWRSPETFPRPAPRVHLVPSAVLGSEDREAFRCLYRVHKKLC